MVRTKRLFGVAAAALAAATLAGCTPAPPPPEQLVGETLEQTENALQGPFIILDISQNVIGKSPSYDDGKDPAGWSVLVACKSASGSGYVVAVIPRSAATKTIVTSARAGDYGSFVDGCSKG
ncbi:hypothetical protein GCM10023171_22520 [Microbacterium panaciterrae]|uniref:Uncharacterized protein n=1 Tax=Microbacterium panaciterrae TaxID=985759 RepID=A0ABP8PI79_9MICO